MLGQRRHRAVLCDIDIPGVDGMQFLHRVCAGFPEVAVIVVTGPGDLCGGILAMISGASGYIQAPFESENIAAKIGSALKRKHLESALRA
jgi:FixJ family two-component response regulator